MWGSFFEDYGQANFLEYDLSELSVDEAFLTISSSYQSNLTLFHKSSLCNECPYRRVNDFNESENLTLKYDTQAYWSYLVKSYTQEEFVTLPDNSLEEVCHIDNIAMGEFGVYNLLINEKNCDVETLKEPVSIYSGLILAAIFYIFLAICWFVIKQSCKKINRMKEGITNKEFIMELDQSVRRFSTNCQIQVSREPITTGRVRLRSLDTFRGFTIMLMILVNYGSGHYWFLEHAPWDGLRVADVIFPWFLWIMGVCIPMGLKSQLKRKTPKKKIFKRIVMRSLKLFMIGIILNSVGGHNSLENYRIPGVLQRFAISYFVISSVALLTGSTPEKDPTNGFCGAIDDIIVLFPQWVLYILLIIGYTMFIFYMPLPGCPRGYFGPGGISLFQEGKPSPDCIGGVTRMVDIALLSDKHIYQHPTARSIYESSSFDPEGILGSVPTLLQVFIGMQAGQILLSFENPSSRIKRWLLWGLLTLIGSLALSSGTLIGGPIPVNKNLWSLSFVLITSSLAFFFLTFCFVMIDLKRLWNGSPFYQTGMNSIFLYVAHFFTYNVFPWKFRYGEMKTHLSLFSQAMFGTTLWVIVALYLHKKKKFYTV